MTSQARPSAAAQASRQNGAGSHAPVTAMGWALAAWRAGCADRIEAALFSRHLGADGHRPAAGSRAALIRDGNGPRAIRARVGRAVLMHRPRGPTGRAIETLLRYRGSVLAGRFRALGALKALQGEARVQEEPGTATLLPPARETKRTRAPQES